MRKTKKKNYLVIALVVILLALAVGYAAFQTQLTITGTATAKGNWNVHFVAKGASGTRIESTGTPAIANDKMDVTLDSKLETATITVNLTQPGQAATVTLPIINEGTADAVIDSFTIDTPVGTDNTAGNSTTLSGTSPTYTFGVIKAELNVSGFKNGDELAAGATTATPYQLKFTWVDDGSTTVDQKLTFNITFNYKQKTA